MEPKAGKQGLRQIQSADDVRLLDAEHGESGQDYHAISPQRTPLEKVFQLAFQLAQTSLPKEQKKKVLAVEIFSISSMSAAGYYSYVAFPTLAEKIVGAIIGGGAAILLTARTNKDRELDIIAHRLPKPENCFDDESCSAIGLGWLANGADRVCGYVSAGGNVLFTFMGPGMTIFNAITNFGMPTQMICYIGVGILCFSGLYFPGRGNTAVFDKIWRQLKIDLTHFGRLFSPSFRPIQAEIYKLSDWIQFHASDEEVNSLFDGLKRDIVRRESPKEHIETAVCCYQESGYSWKTYGRIILSRIIFLGAIFAAYKGMDYYGHTPRDACEGLMTYVNPDVSGEALQEICGGMGLYISGKFIQCFNALVTGYAGSNILKYILLLPPVKRIAQTNCRDKIREFGKTSGIGVVSSSAAIASAFCNFAQNNASGEKDRANIILSMIFTGAGTAFGVKGLFGDLPWFGDVSPAIKRGILGHLFYELAQMVPAMKSELQEELHQIFANAHREADIEAQPIQSQAKESWSEWISGKVTGCCSSFWSCFGGRAEYESISGADSVKSSALR